MCIERPRLRRVESNNNRCVLPQGSYRGRHSVVPPHPGGGTVGFVQKTFHNCHSEQNCKAGVFTSRIGWTDYGRVCSEQSDNDRPLRIQAICARSGTHRLRQTRKLDTTKLSITAMCVQVAKYAMLRSIYGRFFFPLLARSPEFQRATVKACETDGQSHVDFLRTTPEYGSITETKRRYQV